MIHGSCLCGAVAFAVDGELEATYACHCTICRKLHGTAYGAYGLTDQRAFRYTRGEQDLRSYRSSADGLRYFCAHCGSTLPDRTQSGRVAVPLGVVDGGGPELRIAAHIFVDSRVCWQEITDRLPRHPAWPPGLDLAVQPTPARLRAGSRGAGAEITGSCLCGRVAYALERPPAGMRHCHCSRCRKARSAPHATNATGPQAGFRFSRGADQLTTYRVADARFFASVFCRHCGSPMPRVDDSRDLVIIPAGSFDDDPGVRLYEHIFVASKAAWFEITDDLPQLAERD